MHPSKEKKRTGFVKKGSRKSFYTKTATALCLSLLRAPNLCSVPLLSHSGRCPRAALAYSLTTWLPHPSESWFSFLFLTLGIAPEAGGGGGPYFFPKSEGADHSGQIHTCLLGFLVFYRLAVVFCHIQALVNVAWDRFNFCSQLLLNTFQVESIIICDQVDG